VLVVLMMVVVGLNAAHVLNVGKEKLKIAESRTVRDLRFLLTSELNNRPASGSYLAWLDLEVPG